MKKLINELDLIYPKGHEKAGLLLDRVCFINELKYIKSVINANVNIPYKAIQYFEVPSSEETIKSILDNFNRCPKSVKDTILVFGTNLPYIIQDFAPYEIIDLRIDKKGNLYRNLWYEGENHVDNYLYDPRYLNNEDILRELLGLDVYSEIRSDALMEYAILKKRLEKLRKEHGTESDEFQDTLNEFQRIGNLLRWNIKN